jgi:trigger factor
MSVVVSLQDVGPCRKQLTVEVPAPAVEAETQRVIKEFGQRVRIPGFRKGKVPADLVRRRFAKDIEREVIDRLLPRYWRQAEAESEIQPLLPPEVDEVRDREPGAPLTFVATVETRPAIELRNIRDFELPDPQVEPGDIDVDQALEDLRTRLGTWAPVERPAARGDRVSGEIAEAPATPATEASGAPGDAPGDNFAGAQQAAAAPKTQPIEVEVGDPRVWEELSLALSGLAAGQETTFERQDGDPPQTRRYRVRVSRVEERELPPADDAFAARVNPKLESLEALREALARSLREARAEDRMDQRQRALLDQLRERHPMELPRGVVQNEVEHLVNDYAQGLARRGVKPEQAGIDWKQAAEEMRPLAERRVHARLLLDAIADADAVAVGDEEFERALAGLARAQGTSTPALRRSLDESGRLAGLRSQLRRDKTIRHLLGEEPADASPEHAHDHHGHPDHEHGHGHPDHQHDHPENHHPDHQHLDPTPPERT